MCKHDQLILQKLEQLETAATETRKIAEDNIAHLRNDVATHTAFTREKLIDMASISRIEFDNLKEDLNNLKKDSIEIKAGVKLTNGRVNDLEHFHSSCAIQGVVSDYNDYKNKMKPVYLLATSWKMIVAFGIIFATAITVGRFIIDWAAKLTGINLPQ